MSEIMKHVNITIYEGEDSNTVNIKMDFLNIHVKEYIMREFESWIQKNLTRITWEMVK